MGWQGYEARYSLPLTTKYICFDRARVSAATSPQQALHKASARHRRKMKSKCAYRCLSSTEERQLVLYDKRLIEIEVIGQIRHVYNNFGNVLRRCRKVWIE